jgi:thioredoxin reductase/SAM-dependent methyltransferase
VVVVGGSAAGLAAALQLGRQRRSVMVVDAGEPRNAPADHMHGYLGHEGLAPGALADIGREEVRSYGGEVVSGRVSSVRRSDDDRFRVEVEGKGTVVARRVIAASGLVDELPEIDGLAEHWGREVIHCPFCHGYEVRDLRIVQVVTHPVGLHPAPLFRQLTARLTIVVHDGVEEDHPELAALRAAGVPTVHQAVRRVASADGRLAVELADGTLIDADAVAVGPRFRARVEPFADLGLSPVPHPSGLGDHIETDASGETSVPGVFAAGNVTDPSQQVLHAAANGSRVGAMVSFSLAGEDLEDAARPSSVAGDWDSFYSGDQVWSGNPNGSLVAEATGLEPGRALDVGAGEGGDALWLAQQGWKVTANDVSSAALARLERAARRLGLDVELHHGDVNDLDVFPEGAFDLVSAAYLPIPRSPDHRGVQNLLRAVAPGGRLVFVSHDLEPLLAGDHSQGGLRDHRSYVWADEIAAVVAGTDEWTVEVHERRPRPAGAASHHADDVVLRVRRRPA